MNKFVLILLNIVWIALAIVLMLFFLCAFGAEKGMYFCIGFAIVGGLLVPVVTRDKNNIGE